MTRFVLQAFALGALWLLAACADEDPMPFPMSHDNLVTCRKTDGSRYVANDGNCRGDVQVRECWLAPGNTVWVSPNECREHGGRRPSASND